VGQVRGNGRVLRLVRPPAFGDEGGGVDPT